MTSLFKPGDRVRFAVSQSRYINNYYKYSVFTLTDKLDLSLDGFVIFDNKFLYMCELAELELEYEYKEI
jgi:hypothetical protein